MQDMYMGNPLGSQLPVVDGEPDTKSVWSSFETHKRINDVVVAENLLPYPYDINDGDTFSGVTATINADGSVTLNGTATSEMGIRLLNIKQNRVWKAGTYTLSRGATDASVSLYDIDNKRVAWTKTTLTFTLTEDTIADFRINTVKGATYDNVTIYPMVEVGSVAHEYQPSYLSRQNLSTNLNTLNNNLVYKKADNYADAFAYAISEIVIVGKATLNGNTIALSLCIPKLAITDTWTYWMNSATYNNNTRFLQASIKNAAINNLFFYEGNTLINDTTFEFYYK